MAGQRPGPVTPHPTQYTLDVPPGVAELVVTTWGGECARADLDLLVNFQERVRVDPTAVAPFIYTIF